jgi:hypothetical protein
MDLRKIGFKNVAWRHLDGGRFQWHVLANTINEVLGFIKEGELPDWLSDY